MIATFQNLFYKFRSQRNVARCYDWFKVWDDHLVYAYKHKVSCFIVFLAAIIFNERY